MTRYVKNHKNAQPPPGDDIDSNSFFYNCNGTCGGMNCFMGCI